MIKNQLIISVLCLIVCICVLIVIVIIRKILLNRYKNNLLMFAVHFNDMHGILEEFIDERNKNPRDFRNFVMLKDHRDLVFFTEHLFFNDLILGIGEKMIPDKKLYGFCAILVSNYTSIRTEIMQEIYRWEASYSVLNINGIESQRVILEICSQQQNILYKNKTISSFDKHDLYNFIKTFGIYFVYHAIAEDDKASKDYVYLPKSKIFIKN